jgi:hypothetical protein
MRRSMAALCLLAPLLSGCGGEERQSQSPEQALAAQLSGSSVTRISSVQGPTAQEASTLSALETQSLNNISLFLGNSPREPAYPSYVAVRWLYSSSVTSRARE